MGNIYAAEVIGATVGTDPGTARSTFTPLDDVVRGELVALWWDLRRHRGVDLPAEPGLILIAGCKS